MASGPQRAGWLLLASLLWLPSSAEAAERSVLLRWLPPPEPDVAGYQVYLGSAPRAYWSGLDLGFVPPDSTGVASFQLGGIDDRIDFYLALTAYDTSGNESVYSNEIVVAALACDPARCDDQNPCTVERCVEGRCVNESVADGTACEDGQFCSVGEFCLSGICTGGVPVECAHLRSTCSTGVCDETLNMCARWPVNSNQSCNDGDICTTRETCDGAVCSGGEPVQCDDGNPCTVDRCYPRVGCVSVTVLDGSACDDGDACTVGEVCRAGVCGPGTPGGCIEGADGPLADGTAVIPDAPGLSRASELRRALREFFSSFLNGQNRRWLGSSESRERSQHRAFSPRAPRRHAFTGDRTERPSN